MLELLQAKGYGLTATPAPGSLTVGGRSRSTRTARAYRRSASSRCPATCTANGYAVLARRADIQRVVAEFTAFFQERLYAYAAAGRYPVNGPVEIRVTGLDLRSRPGRAPGPLRDPRP